jgi:hypothetical protein
MQPYGRKVCVFDEISGMEILIHTVGMLQTESSNFLVTM